MIVKLLTEHHLEFLSITGGCGDSSVYTCQNVKLLEISIHGSLNVAAFLKRGYRQLNALTKLKMAVNTFGNIYYIVPQKCITIHLYTA